MAYDDCFWAAFPTASYGTLTALYWWCAKTSDERNEVKDLVAAWLVGNGVLLLIAPWWRTLLWLSELPQGLRKLTLWYADHPTVMRLRGIAGVGIGTWLALRQYQESSGP